MATFGRDRRPRTRPAGGAQQLCEKVLLASPGLKRLVPSGSMERAYSLVPYELRANERGHLPRRIVLMTLLVLVSMSDTAPNCSPPTWTSFPTYALEPLASTATVMTTVPLTGNGALGASLGHCASRIDNTPALLATNATFQRDGMLKRMVSRSQKIARGIFRPSALLKGDGEPALGVGQDARGRFVVAL